MVLGAIPQIPQRFACRVLGFCRSSVRLSIKGRPRDDRMKAILQKLAREVPWNGYRRMKLAVCAGFERIGENAVRRLMKLMDLRVTPLKRRRKRRLHLQVIPGLRSERLNHVWCMDFMKDMTSDGRALRILSIVDEYTRECLGLEVKRSFKANDVVAVLEKLIRERGKPVYVRSDNGPEFVAKEIGKWADGKGVLLVHSEPASPWQNPFSETFHSRARFEFLERELFGGLLEAKVLCEVYRWWYNNRRGHSKLGNMTPAKYA
ncbi:MAG: IS3 family transposase, partial [Anaerolineales bacterium]|nr:IS3 family transposase [Anaerolineales bacterium]